MLKSVFDIDFKELKIHHALGVNYLRSYEIHRNNFFGDIIIIEGGNRWDGNAIDIPHWLSRKIQKAKGVERDKVVLDFAESHLIRNEHNIRKQCNSEIGKAVRAGLLEREERKRDECKKN